MHNFNVIILVVSCKKVKKIFKHFSNTNPINGFYGCGTPDVDGIKCFNCIK